MSDLFDVVAFIFARGGSKGIPGKNLVQFSGKPLIAWSIEHAKRVPRVRRVIVSTDSEEIAATARLFGAETPFMRPAELSTDDSPEWQGWQHALSEVRREEGRYPSAFLSVPTTAPLRKSTDIETCLDVFFEGDSDVVITTTSSHRNPYFNMVKPTGGGYYGLVNGDQGTFYRRQDAPLTHDMTTVAYVASPTFIMNSSGIFSGRVRAVPIPIERAIDIDTPLDLRVAEFLFVQG